MRGRLSHTPPSFVDSGAPFLLTICVSRRGINQLANADVWTVLREAAEHYHQQGRWHVRVLLAMPDHVHAIASFPAVEQMATVISAWKHYTAHAAHVAWQRDFFDQRLRSHESGDEKAHYIAMNPVRAGLVSSSEAWPYRWSPENRPALPV